MFPAIIFDFNGVLVDDEAVHRAAFRDALAPLGVTFSDQAYLDRYLGYDDRGAFAAILADAGHDTPNALIDQLIEVKRPHYMRRAQDSLRIFDGASEIVRRAASFGQVAIVSGALRDEITFALDRMGISDHIPTIISAEDTLACKPDPEGYLIALERLAPLVGKLAARRALVIEDSIAGVQAAKGAGLRCLGVEHSYPASELRGAGADWVVARIGEVDEPYLRGLAAKSASDG